MASYLARRIGYSLAVLWGVATLVFFLFHVLPADSARPTLGQRNDSASVEVVRKTLRLDMPLATRYWLFLGDLSPLGIVSGRTNGPTGPNSPTIKLLQQDNGRWLVLKAPFLGRSVQSNRLVSAILAEGLPGTLILAGTALLFAIILGILFGVLAALVRGSAFDSGAVAAFLAGVSLPPFLVALVIAYLFGHLFSDYTGLEMTGSLYVKNAHGGWHIVWKNLILPTIALSLRPMAIIADATRSALLEVLNEDYIQTAYAKGLSKAQVVWWHAIPNALNLLLRAGSGGLAELLMGAVFIEFIFGWTGIGKITVEALQKFDFPLVMGAALLFALIFIVVKLVADILHGVLDPRVRV